MTRTIAVAALALALTAGSALAADLPSSKGPPPVYVPPAPVFSWTGLYGGANVGYGFGNGDQVPGVSLFGSAWSVDQDLHGVVGGGQFGYNYQFSPWLVVGLEADIQAADLRTSRSFFTPAITDRFGTHFGSVQSSQNVDWYGSIRGRVGLVLPSIPNLMVFGTGGFAYGQVSHNFNYSEVFAGGVVFGNQGISDTQTGWTAGGGVEWSPPIFPALSLKVEYLYTDLGSTTINNPLVLTTVAGAFPVSIAQQTAQTRFHTVKAGLNLHFNPFATAPVLAKF